MKKNVLGFIALFSGIAAFICIIIAFIPTTPIAGSSLSLYGGINVACAGGSIFLGLVALITGIISMRFRDKMGPRKAGMIIGIFAIIIGLISFVTTSISKVIVDYANKVPGNVISQMDDESRKTFDDSLKELIEKYPAK